MAMGRPKSTLVLDSELREQLESLANSRSLPAGLVRRAKIILLRGTCACGGLLHTPVVEEIPTT